MFFNSLLTNFAALEVGQHLYWQIGNIRLHGQVFLTSWILLGALLVFISLGTKKMENDPKGLQNLLEFLWDYIRDLAELGAPTADINTTIALALLVSLSYFYAGLSNKGWRYFEYYVHPTPIMLPFKILEDFTKPLSLSFRLFGNILADELVVGVLVFLVPLILPIPVMFLGLFTSAIQALIFATLAAYYIGEAVEEHH